MFVSKRLLAAAFLVFIPAVALAAVYSILSANAHYHGIEYSQEAGISLSSAGDVNSDGYGDVLVGTLTLSTSEDPEGVAYLILGGTSHKTGPWPKALDSVSVKFTGENSTDQFGNSVGGLGDVNGDGYADFAISAWYESTAATRAGATYVFYGGSGVTGGSAGTIADAKLLGEMSNDRSSLPTSVGDLDSDGYADFTVSAKDYDSSTGRVYVYYGSSTTITNGSLADADAILDGEHSSDHAGFSVDGVLDFNGDGNSDLAVSAPYHDNGATPGTGIVYLIDGASVTDMSLADADAAWVGDSAQDRLGRGTTINRRTLYGGRDYTGDGLMDLVVCSDYYINGSSNVGVLYIIPGSTTFTSGSVGTAAWVKVEGDPGSGMRFCSSIDGGDHNADREWDLAIGATGYDGSASPLYYEGALFLAHGPFTAGSYTASAFADTYYGVESQSSTGTAVAMVPQFQSLGAMHTVFTSAPDKTWFTPRAGMVYAFFGENLAL